MADEDDADVRALLLNAKKARLHSYNLADARAAKSLSAADWSCVYSLSLRVPGCMPRDGLQLYRSDAFPPSTSVHSLLERRILPRQPRLHYRLSALTANQWYRKSFRLSALNGTATVAHNLLISIYRAVIRLRKTDEPTQEIDDDDRSRAE